MLNFNQYDERQQRAVARVVEKLSYSGNRTLKHYSQSRNHERKKFGALVDLEAPASRPGECIRAVSVFAYDISRGGIGLIAPFEFKSEYVRIGMILPNDQRRWKYGRVVRRRAIPDELFWDYGIAFCRDESEVRADDGSTDEPPQSSAEDIETPSNTQPAEHTGAETGADAEAAVDPLESGLDAALSSFSEERSSELETAAATGDA